MTADRDIELSHTLNLLAALIGSLAYPNPDDDEPHGPGAPHIRAELAAVRRVTISVAQWAEHLGEQAVASQNESKTPESDRDASKSNHSPSSGTTRGEQTADDDCDPGTDSILKKHPPATTMRIITPSVRRFVADLLNGSVVHLPVAVSGQSDPWRLSLGDPQHRGVAALIAGAQFQFAAQATRLGHLTALFQWAARELLRGGIKGIGQDPAALAREAI